MVTIDPRNRHEMGLELAWTLQTKGNSQMPYLPHRSPLSELLISFRVSDLNQIIGGKRSDRRVDGRL